MDTVHISAEIGIQLTMKQVDPHLHLQLLQEASEYGTALVAKKKFKLLA